MRRTKSIACHSHMVATSSSSNEDDISLGAYQEEAPASSPDAASSNAISQHRGGDFAVESIHPQV